jgi:uncharacterized protein YkwD
VAIGRRAYTVIRRHLQHALVAASLLALCACCCALASTAPASTGARPHSQRAASFTSSPPSGAPKRHRRCARKAGYHAGSVTPGASHRRASCRRKHRRHGHRHHSAPPAHGACTGTQLRPSTANLALVRAATLCLVNRERARHGESALQPNQRLQTAAQGHSLDMSSGDYFEHDGRGGSTPLSRMRAAGYIFSSHIGYAVGENIAWGTLWLASPKSIVAGWMASPEHRANILDAEFHDSGIGVSPHAIASGSGGEPGAVYTQDFGRILRP